MAEIAVLRFMPPSKDVWPDRFVQKVGFQQELLTATAEPSFESAALKSHNMQSARAFVGLKDHPSETGVAWDGTLIGRERSNSASARRNTRWASMPIRCPGR